MSTPSTSNSRTQEVMALFSTLQRMNEDVHNEARRVRAVIKDARAVVNDYREEIKTRANQVKMQQTKNRREETTIDSEVWLREYK